MEGRTTALCLRSSSKSEKEILSSREWLRDEIQTTKVMLPFPYRLNNVIIPLIKQCLQTSYMPTQCQRTFDLFNESSRSYSFEHYATDLFSAFSVMFVTAHKKAINVFEPQTRNQFMMITQRCDVVSHA